MIYQCQDDIKQLLNRRVLPLNAEAAEAQNALSGELSDSVTNILSVKTYGREDFERAIFDAANAEVVRTDSRRMRTSNVRGAMTSTLIVCIMIVVTVFMMRSGLKGLTMMPLAE